MRTRSTHRLRLPLLAILAVFTIAAVTLVSNAFAAVNADTAINIANAIKSPSANVTGAGFVLSPSASAHGIGTFPPALGGFPTDGNGFGILTTGLVGSVDDAGTFASTDLNGGNTTDGLRPRGNSALDVTILRVDLAVPAGANCLALDFKFLSEEYPRFVGSAYNDAFIAELDSNTWTTNNSSIIAPNNFAFDTSNNVVSINSTGLGGMSAAAGAGTAFNGGAGEGGATGLLSAATQVSPGNHSLYLSIFDQNDQIYDSAVFLDNLQVGFVPNPTVNCKSGAHPVNYQLSLAPQTATNPTGTEHTVTATLANASGPIANAVIDFSVSGANTTSGTGTTDANGQTTFTYTGTNSGDDNITACYNADDDADTCEAVAFATKTWINSPPTADAGGPYSGEEGSATSISGTAGDTDGDTLTTTWTAAPFSGVDAGATCTFADATALSTTVTCTDDGVWNLTLSADDGHNPPVTSTVELTVSNADPTVSISSPADSSLIALGSPINLSGTLADAGANDTHTCAVTWDGAGADGAGTVTESDGSGTCTASATPTAPGVYTITMTVTDDDGASASASVMVIVYDPSAGFVTGGGWINSPAGAYVADPDLTGKASFGFVSKYKKGASVPTGQTEFQFQAGSFNFHSDTYQWLVVAGKCKAQFKGTGTVNGAGSYGFLLTATDGDGCSSPTADQFRIKIWDTTTGDVVYDNNIGGSDDLDAAGPQNITGGSIVIHTK